MTASSSNPRITHSHPHLSLPLNEIELKVQHDLLSKEVLEGYTRKATDEQQKLRNLFLNETTHVSPYSNKSTSSSSEHKVAASCAIVKLPILKIKLEDVCRYLQTRLQEAALLEMGPSFIGGVATHLVTRPAYALEFSDLDVCFSLTAPFYDLVKDIFVDFLRLQLEKLPTDKNFPELKDFLNSKIANLVIYSYYLYKKVILKDRFNVEGGCFYGLGAFEFKFFYKTTCRQNVFKSDGFRFPIFGEKIFCMDVDAVCKEDAFNAALDAAERRQCVVSKPEEVADYLFKLAQKATQGYEFPPGDIITPGLTQFAKMLTSLNPEQLRTKLLHHHENHYKDDVGKLFDFMHFLIFIGSNRDFEARTSQCLILANALKSDKESLVGKLAMLVAEQPDQTEDLILLIQGALLQQLLKGNVLVSGYDFKFDPSHLRYAVAITNSQCTHYLMLQDPPETLAQKFLESWTKLEGASPKIHSLLSEFLQQFKFGPDDFSARSKLSSAEDLFQNFEKSPLISKEKCISFYQSLECFQLKGLPEKLLVLNLTFHLNEAIRFRQTGLEQLISIVMLSIKNQNYDFFENLDGLSASISEMAKGKAPEFAIHPHLKKILSEWLLKILLELTKKKLEPLSKLCTLATSIHRLEFFDASQTEILFDPFFKDCDGLLNTEKFESLTLASRGLLEISQWRHKSESMEKQLGDAFIRLSYKFSLDYKKFKTEISKDFKTACNFIDRLIEMRMAHYECSLKEIEEMLANLIGWANQVQAPALLYNGALTVIKLLEAKISLPHRYKSMRDLSNALLVLPPNEHEKATPLALRILQLLQDCDENLGQDIAQEFIKKMANLFFGKHLKEFREGIKTRESEFKSQLKVLLSLAWMRAHPEEALGFQKIMDLDFAKEHSKIRNFILDVVMKFDHAFVLKILTTHAEFFSPEELLRQHCLSAKKLSEENLEQAYGIWLRHILACKAVKNCLSHKIVSTVSLLAAYAKIEGKLPVERIDLLMDFLSALLKESHLKLEQWRKEEGEELPIIQKEFTQIVKSLACSPKVFLLKCAERLMISEQTSPIISLEAATELFLPFLIHTSKIESYPRALVIDLYRQKFLPSLAHKVKREDLQRYTRELIAQSIESGYDYDAAFYLFQEALRQNLFDDPKEYEVFFFAIINHFPEGQGKVRQSELIAKFINLLEEKNFLLEMPLKIREAFLENLLNLKEPPYDFILKHIQKFSGPKVIKLYQLFCKRAALDSDPKVISFLHQILRALGEKADALVYQFALKGLSSRANRDVFDALYLLIYNNLMKEGLFSPAELAYCSRYLIEWTIINNQNFKTSSPTLQQVETFRRNLLLACDPKNSNIRSLNSTCITLFRQHDGAENLLTALKILNSSYPSDTMVSFFEILEEFLKIDPSQAALFEHREKEIEAGIEVFFNFHEISLQAVSPKGLDYFDYVKILINHKITFLTKIGQLSLQSFLRTTLQKGQVSRSHSPKNDENILEFLTHSIRHSLTTPDYSQFSTIVDLAKLLVPEKVRYLTDLIKTSLEVVEKMLNEKLDAFLHQPKNEPLETSLTMVRELIRGYAKLDPTRATQLAEGWIVAIHAHSKFYRHAGELLEECYFIFDKKTITSWEKVEILKKEPLSQSLRARMGVAALAFSMIAESDCERVLDYAQKTLKAYASFVDLNDSYQVDRLISCHEIAHEKALFQVMKMQNAKACEESFNQFMELLDRNCESSLNINYSYCINSMVLPFLALPLLIKKSCEKALLLYQGEDLDVALNHFMRTPDEMKELKASMRATFDFFAGEIVLDAFTERCLNQFLSHSKIEQERVLDANNSKLLMKLLGSMLNAFSKTKFFNFCSIDALKYFRTIITRLDKLKTIPEKIELAPELVEDWDKLLESISARIEERLKGCSSSSSEEKKTA